MYLVKVLNEYRTFRKVVLLESCPEDPEKPFRVKLLQTFQDEKAARATYQSLTKRQQPKGKK